MMFSKRLSRLVEDVGVMFSSVPYFMGLKKSETPRLLDREATLVYAIDKNCSIARFGDGEMLFTFAGHKRSFKGIHFQKPDKKLSARLYEILSAPHDHLLLCFNNAFSQQNHFYSLVAYKRDSKKCDKMLSVRKDNDVEMFIRWRQRYQYCKWLNRIRRHSSLDILGDATCFFLCLYVKEYTTGSILDICSLYKKLFEGRRVLFVGPETPHMGVSFRELCRQGVIQSPESMEFLSIPPNNTFGYYDEILQRILRMSPIDAVFLQAGPTATVLAAELTIQYGVCAYDVGSLNVSLQKAFTVHGFSF